MFRTWALLKLTQLSAWASIFLIFLGPFMPKIVLICVGAVLLLNDDGWLQSRFKFLRDELEKRWKA